jgi:uncharacterized membrane protein YphA (DoxX/SURF4 family)
MDLDYQIIINMVAQIISVALPIGVVFGLAERLVNAFLSMAFGERKVRL